jgi:hypothetical protein
MPLVWVERPTWLFPVATCRRAGVRRPHSSVRAAMRPADGLVARQNGLVARSTQKLTARFRLERFQELCSGWPARNLALTPALSRWEREKRAPFSANTKSEAARLRLSFINGHNRCSFSQREKVRMRENATSAPSSRYNIVGSALRSAALVASVLSTVVLRVHPWFTCRVG